MFKLNESIKDYEIHFNFMCFLAVWGLFNQYGGSFVLANAHSGVSDLYRASYYDLAWYNRGEPYEYVFKTSDSELDGYIIGLA